LGAFFCEYGGFEMKLNLKTVLTGSAATVALLAASSANASGYYIGLFGGISTLEDDFDLSTATSSSSTVTSATNKGGTAVSSLAADTAWSLATFDTLQGYSGTSVGTNTGFTGQPGLTNYLNRTNVTYAARLTTFSANNVGFDDGFVLGGAIGWDFGNGWRNELEVAYRKNDIEDSAVTTSFSRAYTHYDYMYYQRTRGLYYYTRQTYVGLNTLTTTGVQVLKTQNSASGTASSVTTGSGINGSVSGDIESWSFMYNIWHDFDFGDSPIHPFIGGGIGFVNAKLTVDMHTDGATTTPYGIFGLGGYSYRGNGEATDWGFAYQLGAGLGYDFGNGMMLSAQYRYFNTGAMDLSLQDQIEVNLESHNFLVGLNIPLGGGM